MKTKQIKGVLMQCSDCYRLIPFEDIIADKTTCPVCGGTAEALGFCTMVVKQREEGINTLIEKQWELFGKMLNEQTEYITGEVLRRLQNERNND